MTKMLVCGMPLDEVIKASTSTPAAAIGYGDKIGTLRVGAEADIALLEMRRTDFMLEDSQAQTRRCTQRLIARGVWRAGVAGKITSPEQVGAFPNLRNVALHRPSWNILVVRDIVAPPEVSPEFQAMVEQRLAEMEKKAEEWMKSSPVGDGNPNTPLWLTVLPTATQPVFPRRFSRVSLALLEAGSSHRREALHVSLACHTVAVVRGWGRHRLVGRGGELCRRRSANPANPGDRGPGNAAPTHLLPGAVSPCTPTR